MARRGLDLDGVVSFHGALDTEEPAQSGAVTARILVLHDAADAFVPQDLVEEFKQEMEAAGGTYEFIAYEGATHRFTSPEADALGAAFEWPLAYNADAQSWQAMQNFFKTIF